MAELVFEEGAALELSADLVLKYGLAKGKKISEETFNIISREQRIIEAKRAAYSYASYKPRTEKQVRDKLRQKYFVQEDTDVAIAFLYEFNLLDDELFALTFVKDFISRKPAAPPRLIAELRNRGIDRETAEAAIIEAYPENDKLDLAKEAAEKKLRSLRGKPEEKIRRSLAAYLQRQGFGWDIIKQVVDARDI